MKNVHENFNSIDLIISMKNQCLFHFSTIKIMINFNHLYIKWMNFHYCLCLNHFILIDIYLFPIPNFILKIHHLLLFNYILDFTLMF